MRTERVRIFFEDEAPRIGCGWRICTARVGWNWAHVDYLGRRKRFSLAQYAALKPTAI